MCYSVTVPVLKWSLDSGTGYLVYFPLALLLSFLIVWLHLCSENVSLRGMVFEIRCQGKRRERKGELFERGLVGA